MVMNILKTVAEVAPKLAPKAESAVIFREGDIFLEFLKYMEETGKKCVSETVLEINRSKRVAQNTTYVAAKIQPVITQAEEVVQKIRLLG